MQFDKPSCFHLNIGSVEGTELGMSQLQDILSCIRGRGLYGWSYIPIHPANIEAPKLFPDSDVNCYYRTLENLRPCSSPHDSKLLMLASVMVRVYANKESAHISQVKTYRIDNETYFT